MSLKETVASYLTQPSPITIGPDVGSLRDIQVAVHQIAPRQFRTCVVAGSLLVIRIAE